MADLVGLQAQTPDVMGKLSQLLHIQGQRAQVQQETQTANQRAALAKFDYNQLLGDDGTFDLNKIPLIQQAAGDQYPEIARHLIDAKSAQIDAKSRLLNLNTDQLNTYRSMVGGLLQDKDVVEDNDKGRQKVNDAYIQFGDMYGKDALPVLDAYARRLQNVPKGKLKDAIVSYQMQAEDAGNQLEKQRPTFTSKGDVLTNVNPYSLPTKDIPLGLPPGAQIVTDAYGRQGLLNPQDNSIRWLGTGKAPAGGFTQPVPQQHEIEGEIDTTRKADADYGVNRHVNDQLLRLSKDTSTGPGTDIWHHALGAMGATFGGNNVADYQTINAYLDRQAALSAKQMGLPDTNAGLATAASLSGTTSYQPKALQTKVHLTDALVEGAHQYRQGLDKVVGTGPNQDLSKYQAYRAAWSANFDPNVFRAENALKRLKADPNDELARGELNEIKKEAGPKGMAELKKKSDALRKLSQGEIP